MNTLTLSKLEALEQESKKGKAQASLQLENHEGLSLGADVTKETVKTET